MKRIACILLALLMFAVPVLPVRADETGEAENISGEISVLQHNNISEISALFDGNQTKSVALGAGASLSLEHSGGIGAAYLIFDYEYGTFTVTDPVLGESREFGTNGLYHEFADIEGAFGYAPQIIEITFDSGAAQLNELFLFSPGTVPSWVQRWELPKEGETDLVLFSTHGDDEQLFFAGLLPYYAKEKGYQCQVVYLTDHRNKNTHRVHEMLNGLWAVGVDTYPILGNYPDQFCESKRDAYGYMAMEGITEEELVGFVVDNLRRFKPLVAVGHDLGGEYGHGQHMLYADMLIKAIEISDDPQQYPQSAQQYGTWDVPKTYLHLYTKNTIRMDWDQPLESFDGMTAFLVSKDLGFAAHVSQQENFGWFIKGQETAEEINYCSPCRYGLYRSTVGLDVEKTDLFENLTTYAQKKTEEEAARLAAEEEARRLEEARLAAEAEAEAQRLEAERLKQEEAERAAAEAEFLRLQQQQEAARQEQQRGRKLLLWGLAGVVTALVLLGVVVSVMERKKKI